MSDLKTEKQKIFDYIYAMLGGGMVDVELDPIHYEAALEKALNKYRQRADNSVEESYIILPTEVDVNEYILPQEVMEVRQLFRRGVGSRSDGGGESGSQFDPFNLAYTNTYLMAGTKTGGLLTYELFSQYQELVGRMFGSYIEFKWNNSTKKLTILQRPRSQEEILMFVYNHRPDFQLFNDYLAKQWIRDYALATCKYMLGEARGKFPNIAGPQGGGSLNGPELKAEAAAEQEKLEADLMLQIAGGKGYGFLIG